VGGTTGEGVTMSVAERCAVVERWVKTSAGRVGIIAHVGSDAIADVTAMATHAAGAGAVAIAAMPTCFFKPENLDRVVDFMAAIAAACPSLPLYYYHLPIKTGVNIRCDKLLAKLEAAVARVPTFVGIKYSDADLWVYANCVAYGGGKYDILYGKDEQLLGALAMGGRGAVGSTYNYAGRAGNAAMAAFQRGDLAAAMAEQRKIQAVVDILYEGASYGPAGVNVGKAVMEARLGGKGCGPARCPGVAFPAEGAAKLKADLEAIGFFTW
jgi:N-acetylneuraminate lyase